MMTDEEQKKLHELFEDKISELHIDVFGTDEGAIRLENPLLEILGKRWRDYVEDMGISFMSLGEAKQKWDEPGRFKLANPFYVDNHRFWALDMSLDTAEKILLLGLP